MSVELSTTEQAVIVGVFGDADADRWGCSINHYVLGDGLAVASQVSDGGADRVSAIGQGGA
ncbi:MAG: hypothetical protein KJ560_21265, partial [Gammaproteobacteria bacterium]|nr:hypothetical protein [Gammaproteobacteria bacterium]MBU2425058.1 hypothetical protein [Gammaproteobacteria bacterium]